MTEWKAKRFWDRAAVAGLDEGYVVRLDGRDLRTPAKRLLVLPTPELAERIAAEWQAQEGVIDPLSMPFTRSANASVDKVATQFDEVAEVIAAYGDADGLCYRAEAPAELAALQAENWDPVLDWANRALDARMRPVAGVIHQPQDPDGQAGLHARVRSFGPFELTAFHDLVSLSGSLILGFAVAENHLAPGRAWALSRIDEDWQISQWGEDEEAAAQARNKRADFLHAAEFFAICRNAA